MDARRLVLVLVVLAGISLAGCTIASQESEYPEETEVREKLTSLETVEAEVVSETRAGNDTTTTRMRIAQNLEAGTSRTTTVSGPNGGLTVVNDGEQIWYYEPDRNLVQVIRDVPEARSINATVDMIGTIYQRLDNDGSEDREVGISQAPTVPAPRDTSPGGNQMTLPLGDNVSVSSAGTDTVDGRDVTVVELDVEDDRSQLQNATYYIDEEWHFPLKSRLVTTLGGETQVTTTTYTNVSFDEPIDSGTFEFDPPSTARVVEGFNGSFQQYSSRESLVESVDRSVPKPSLPAAFEFDGAEVNPTGSGQSITMVYADRSSTVTVTKLAGAESNLTEDAESIEVAGQPARRRSVGQSVAVAWTCRGNTYSVVGPEDGPSLADVAESIGCS